MKAIIVATLGMLALHTASAAEVTRYVALVEGGKRAGHQWVTQDGRRTRVEFYFKDNGRGPELKESFTVDESFTFTQYQVKGESTYGSLVNETFSRDGAKARWKSTSDRGEQAVNGAALYSPLSGTPATFSVALSALARAPGGKVAMIPSGTLSQRQLLETTLTGKKSNRPLQLVALTGVGFSPSLVWATTGESPRLFAFIVPGYLQLIEEGWESHAAALEKQQKEAEQKLLVDMNQRLSHALPGTTLIRNARIFDSERALLLPASDLLLERGRIVALSATGAESRKADRVIDAAGRVLLPGLYDMHAHLSQWDGPLHLAAGVTTVRDMGNHNETLLQLIEQEKSGKLLAPRVVPAGFIEGESPMSARGSITISTLEEARRAVDWYHERGFPQIKIYNSFPKEFLPDITEYAHARGMRVSGHVPVHMRAEQVVQAGYDEIQHINQVLLNFLVTDKTDTRTLERFYLPAEKVGDLDFDSKPVQDFIALLAQRRVVIDPTLATFNFIRQSDGVMSQQFAAVADHVPPDVRREFLQAQMKIPDAATEARYTKSYQKMIDFTGRMYRAGIPLVAGTDDIAGFTLHRELELLVEAGLTPSQSLQVATWNGALYSRTLDDRGTIQTGKRADLILVDGDPTRNIADIRKVALVIKGEVAYAPAELYEAIGVKPFAAAVAVK